MTSSRTGAAWYTGAARTAALIVMVALAALAPGPGVGAQEAITLDEAIARALEQSPAMAQSRATLSNARLGRRSAMGAFLPNVSVSTDATRASSSRFDPATQRQVSGSSESYSAGVSGSYTLYSGGRRFDELGRTDADLQAAEASLEEQRYNTELLTKNAFYNALRQEELLEVARSRVEQARTSLDLVRTRAQVGRGTVSDTLRARLELANARQGVIQGEASLRAARFSLGRQVGLDRPVEAVPPGDLEPRPLPLSDEEVLLAAERASPAVVATDFTRGASAAAVQSARAAYLPSLSLGSGYTWSNDAFAFNEGRTSWSLRLTASYPIFNGFNRENQIQRAQDQLRVARLRADDARRGARQEADAALQSLRTAELAITIAREAEQVAAEDLRVVRERYRLGVATILDLITSQIAVEQSQADLITARYDYALARAELEAILGRQL